MTDPPRVYPSTLGFSRRIRRRYMAPATEQGQSWPASEQLVAMGFVRRPSPQVAGPRTPSVASRVIERAVQPALPAAPTAPAPAARPTGQDVLPASATALWPAEPAQTTVEPNVPSVALAPGPPAEQAAFAGEAALRRGFTLDEVRRALQRPARTQPSPPPVQREERQPSQSDYRTRPPAQEVQDEPAVARPRPVSRLVEQPQQSPSPAQPSLEPRAPSPVSGTEASSPMVAPRSTEGTVSRQALQAAPAADAALESARDGPPAPPGDARRTAGDSSERTSPEPIAAPDAGERRTEAAAGHPPLSTGTATPGSLSRTTEEAGEPPLARTVESSDTVPGAVAPEEHIQRAPDLSPPAAVSTPPVSESPLAREPTVTGMPPTASPEARPQRTQISREAAQPPALSPSEFSEVETDASDANGLDTASAVPQAPLDVPLEPTAGGVDVPESAAPDIRRSPTQESSRARAPGAAVPPVSGGAQTAPEAPGSIVDLASAYRAQLARYAAETQASAEAGGPAFGPQSASPGESDKSRMAAGPLAMPEESRAEISPPYPAPVGARVTPPSPINGGVRREARTTAQEAMTDTEQPMPPATYDSARPLQRQTVRLDQALGISSAPTPPPAQPALPVRRSVTQGDTSRAESATEATPATPSPTQAPAEGEPDIEELAERVYAKLRGRLRVERERLGGTRLR